MRVVLDTNILLSALISSSGAHGEDLRGLEAAPLRTGHQRPSARCYPALRPLITASEAGRTINQLRALATVLAKLPHVATSPDPADNFVLAMAQSSKADYLVIGDKSGLLVLERHRNTQIVTASRFGRLIK